MLLVVGLGNKGQKYEHNRHNIGFLAIDEIVRKFDVSPWTKKFSGELCDARLPSPEARIFFLKPQTFMNLSGESVGAAAGFYKIPVEKIIVIYDDLDLQPGKIRVKQGGGNGGHNGLKSIDSFLPNPYIRLRIGIGRPEHKSQVSDYVLSDFTREERELQDKTLHAIADHFPLLMQDDQAGFMNKVALATKS
ncbi:MAG TPA: aminoacyl-tRNA hydrolase [Rickettsiales bacterium]|nr:aminoacyl-tRNA hydrolase [Rickettsiales bacterium]